MKGIVGNKQKKKKEGKLKENRDSPSQSNPLEEERIKTNEIKKKEGELEENLDSPSQSNPLEEEKIKTNEIRKKEGEKSNGLVETPVKPVLRDFNIVVVENIDKIEELPDSLYIMKSDLGTRIVATKKYHKWGTGNNSMGVKTYKCSKGNCAAVMKSWICTNGCSKPGLPKDCCQQDGSRKVVALFKNAHTCKEDQLRNIEVGDIQDILKRTQKLFQNSEVIILEEKDRVPEDIDGDKIFIQPFKKDLGVSEMIRCGRNFTPLKKTGTSAYERIFQSQIKVQISQCTGTYFCTNRNCPYLERFDILHQVGMVDRETNEMICNSCSSTLTKKTCTGQKSAVLCPDMKLLLLHHTGNHECIPHTRKTSEVVEQAVNFFRNNPSAPPTEAFINLLRKSINMEDSNAGDIMAIVQMSVNRHDLKNAKQKARKLENPSGTSTLQAVNHFKKQLENKNPFEIQIKIINDARICQDCFEIKYSDIESENIMTDDCSICKRKLTELGPMVYTTSKEAMRTLSALQDEGPHDIEPLYLDHQPSRIAGDWTVLAGSTYDIDLRAMAPLFEVICKNETALAETFAFALTQEIMNNIENKIE